MPKAKRAQITAVSFEVVCPHCNEAQAEPLTGSLTWTAHDVASNHDIEPACFDCGKVFRVRL